MHPLWSMFSVLGLCAVKGNPIQPSRFVADCAADPLNALSKALSASRTRPDNSPAILEVKGACRITRPLQLDDRDSFLSIVGDWSNNDVKPEISGGVLVHGWKKFGRAACNGCGNIFVASIPHAANVTSMRQFYISRTDKKTLVRANRTQMLFPQNTTQKTPTGFLSPLAKRWNHNSGAGIEMIHRGTSSCNYSSAYQWAELRVPVESIDSAKGSFEMFEPAFSLANSSGAKLPCYVENVFELLGDAAYGKKGDYYIDLRNKKIYFVDVAPPEVAILPQSIGLLVINSVKNISLRDLSFTDSTWLFDEAGYVQTQAGCIMKKPDDTYHCMPGAIEIQGSYNCRVENCSFSRLGAAGLSLIDGTQHSMILGNFFEDISATAIRIGSIDTFNETNLDAQDADNYLSDNIIRFVAREYLGTCGITVFFSRGTTIEHNEVYQVPYTGISIGWGWTATMEALWPRMPWDHGNIVRANYVHHVDGIMGDGGSIYTLGPQGNRPFRLGDKNQTFPSLPLPPLKILPMSQIASNFVELNGWSGRPRGQIAGDGTHGPGGIYTDNGSTGWNVSNNVLNDVTVWAVACYTTGINNNSYIANTLVSTWGPINKQSDCKVLNNTVRQSMDMLTPEERAIVTSAGPRPNRVFGFYPDLTT